MNLSLPSEGKTLKRRRCTRLELTENDWRQQHKEEYLGREFKELKIVGRQSCNSPNDDSHHHCSSTVHERA